MKCSAPPDKNRFFRHWIKFAAASLLAIGLAGCGSSGNSDTATATAAVLPANDTATNPTAAFGVVQTAGIAPVTVNSPPKVNFTVLSDGAVVKGLTTSNARFIIAKLVPGANGGARPMGELHQSHRDRHGGPLFATRSGSWFRCLPLPQVPSWSRAVPECA